MSQQPLEPAWSLLSSHGAGSSKTIKIVACLLVSLSLSLSLFGHFALSTNNRSKNSATRIPASSKPSPKIGRIFSNYFDKPQFDRQEKIALRQIVAYAPIVLLHRRFLVGR